MGIDGVVGTTTTTTVGSDDEGGRSSFSSSTTTSTTTSKSTRTTTSSLSLSFQPPFTYRERLLVVWDDDNDETITIQGRTSNNNNNNNNGDNKNIHQTQKKEEEDGNNNEALTTGSSSGGRNNSNNNIVELRLESLGEWKVNNNNSNNRKDNIEGGLFVFHPFNMDWLYDSGVGHQQQRRLSRRRLRLRRHHPIIANVHMSIASHPTQSFSNDPFLFTSRTSSHTDGDSNNSIESVLDSIPLMTGWNTMTTTTISRSSSSAPVSQQQQRRQQQQRYSYPITPQGFNLVVETVPFDVTSEDNELYFIDDDDDGNKNDNTKKKQRIVAMANRSVQNIVDGMLRHHLIATPITGATWDVEEVVFIPIRKNEKENDSSSSYYKYDDDHAKQHQQFKWKLVYRMVLPFNGAGWSSDALEQAWRDGKTMPKSEFCGVSNDVSHRSTQFFGLSSLQWSDLLVTGSHKVGNIHNSSASPSTTTTVELRPLQKKMWWTWSLSSNHPSDDRERSETDDKDDDNASISNTHSLAYGIQVQAAIVKPTTETSSPSLPYTTSSSIQDWIPPTFLSNSSSCPALGGRELYRVTRRRRQRRQQQKTTSDEARQQGGVDNSKHMKDDGLDQTCDSNNSEQQHPFFDFSPLFPSYESDRPVENFMAEVSSTGTSNNNHVEQTATSPSMNVRIDQVLRRHHTNQGRFESWIEIHQPDLSSTVNDDDINEDDSEKNNFQSYCELKYRQVFPDFVTPIWRSLKVVTDGTDGNGDDGTNHDDMSSSITSTVEWKAEDGSSILHVMATAAGGHVHNPRALPSTLIISLEYAPTFLTLDDFPGDPNRGRELPPAHLSVHCRPTGRTATFDDVHLAVYSNSLLLLPPVPDMSMPFNVISLTSSLYAYIVGTIVTILVRKGSEKIKYKLHPEKRPPSKLKQLKDKFRTKVMGRLRWSGKSRRRGDTDAVCVEDCASDDKPPTASGGDGGADQPAVATTNITCVVK